MEAENSLVVHGIGGGFSEVSCDYLADQPALSDELRHFLLAQTPVLREVGSTTRGVSGVHTRQFWKSFSENLVVAQPRGIGSRFPRR